MIRLNIRTLKITIVALMIAGAFAAVDLYIINVSSYLSGFLLVYLVLERWWLR
jgi:hypothetical protein